MIIYPERQPRFRPRTRSSAPHRNGRGIRGGETAPTATALCNSPNATKDWAGLIGRYRSDDRLTSLANALHVSLNALERLHVGWDGHFWTFPEVNGQRQVVGIATRCPAGTKAMITGSHRGLLIADNWDRNDGTIFVVEGASDTAAMLTMGQSVIGRPSTTGAATELAALLSTVPPERKIVIVGDWDPKPDGRWPGRDGAEKVAQEVANSLMRRIWWSLPPDGVKDVRAWWINRQTEANDEVAARQTGAILSAWLLEHAHEVEPKPATGRLQLIDTPTFEHAFYPIHWLVSGVLVKGQPAVVGGAKKMLKTSLLIDLAVSLGSGVPFLGHFQVPAPVRVGFLSGESGPATIQETFRRIRRMRAPGVAEKQHPPIVAFAH